MKKALLALLLILPACAGAQLRWADTVQGFSSQYTSTSWAAYQALGTPNVFPNCGDVTAAWASASADGQREYLELVCGAPAQVNTIQIYETCAPGAIDTVYLWNPGTLAWVQVYSATAAANATCPNILTIRFPTTGYSTNRIRIAINSPAVTYWNEIDAVGIGIVGNGGAVGESQQLCATGGTPVPFVSWTPAFRDSAGTPSYQWQSSSDGIAWADISSETGSGYAAPAISSPDTLYYRRRGILNTDTAYSNIATISLPFNSINPAVPGAGVWNIYGFNGTDINLNPANVNPRGFYIDSTLGFNTTVDWNSGGSPQSAANWQGCSIGADYFSMTAKRKGFPPGFYTFQMPYHDDPGTAFKNGQQIFYTGGCCGTGTVFNIGHLGPNDTLDARFVEYGGGAGMQVVLTQASVTGGSISAANTALCLGDSVLFSSVAGAAGGQGDMFGSAYHYQWQDSASGGSWMNIAGATSVTFQSHPLADTAHYYRRKVTDDSAYADYSNIIRISADTLRGNPAVWGVNAWRFYAYNGLDMSLNPANTQYRGYYTDTALNFDTQNDWNAYASPSTAANYHGCPVQYDYFTMSIKRVGFPVGPYVVSFPTHDDYIQVYRNGVLVLNTGCCNQNPFVSLGGLNATDTLEYRFGEINNPAYLSTFLRQQSIDGGTIAGEETVCANEQPAIINNTGGPSGGYAPATYAYQWQDSLWGSGIWVNKTGATAISYTPDTILASHAYRRKVTDSTMAFAYSNIIQKIHADVAGNPADTGNGVWNVYGYQGTDITLATDMYKGYYTDSALNTFTTNFYCNGCAMSNAPNWQGCPIGADSYTSVFRRRGFPAGVYTVNVYHDDAAMLLKNGSQLYYSGCCPSSNVNVGFLNADSVIEMRLVEYYGGNFLQATFTKTDSGIAAFRNTNCNTYSLVNVAGNNWWDFTDDSGRVVASLNPAGNNLGTVTLNMKHYGVDSASIPKTSVSGIKYMARYYNWESSAYPGGVFPTPVSVRVYYKQSELDTYKKATSQPGLTAANLRIYHYDGVNEDCSINNNVGGSTSRVTTTNTFTSTGFYLQASIPSFSEIGVSGGNQALPITLTDFEAKRAGAVAQLSWKTAAEYNCKGFEVQRSGNGADFSTIGFVSGSGNKATPSFYAYTDAQPLAGKNYYRLLQTDASGRYDASAVRVVDMSNGGSAGEVSFYPNPVSNELFVQLPLMGTVSIRILTAAGATVHEETYSAANDTRVISMASLPAGIYLVQVRDEQGNHWQQRVTKK